MMFFFFNDTATTEIYTLSLHDALPISAVVVAQDPLVGLAVQGEAVGAVLAHPHAMPEAGAADREAGPPGRAGDRKSTRLNSSHANISYAVFCLKKKKKTNISLLNIIIV